MMAKLAGSRKTKIIASKPRKLLLDAGGLIIDKQGVTLKLYMEGISELVVKQFWCFCLKHLPSTNFDTNKTYKNLKRWRKMVNRYVDETRREKHPINWLFLSRHILHMNEHIGFLPMKHRTIHRQCYINYTCMYYYDLIVKSNTYNSCIILVQCSKILGVSNNYICTQQINWFDAPCI